MPQMYRRGSRSIRTQPTKGSYYRTAKPKRQPFLAVLVLRFRMLPKRTRLIAGAAALVAVLAVGVICLVPGTKPVNNANPSALVTAPVAKDPTVSMPPRKAALSDPLVTPESGSVRDISFGSMRMPSTEKLINSPGVFGKEIFFSAGSIPLKEKDDTLKKLYLYNTETGETRKIADVKIAGGGFYETHITDKWLVWVETDHYDKNYIYVMNRKDGTVTQIKNCKYGKPKLALAGDTLVWNEFTDSSTDQIMMFDLVTQENLSLRTYKGADAVTYGMSAPAIYAEQPEVNPSASATPSPTPSPTPTPTPTVSPTGSPGASPSEEEPDWNGGSDINTTIVWADTDAAQTAEQKQAEEHSTIYWLELGEGVIADDGTLKTQQFSPGTYVHDPKYNGKYFVWIDSNYSPKDTKLYLCEPFGAPKVIDTGITTYSLGDGIVVYGKGQQVWVYIIETGEYCRLTNNSEQGMLPYANGRIVVWYDKTNGGVQDELKFKVLAGQDVKPGYGDE